MLLRTSENMTKQKAGVVSHFYECENYTEPDRHLALTFFARSGSKSACPQRFAVNKVSRYFQLQEKGPLTNPSKARGWRHSAYLPTAAANGSYCLILTRIDACVSMGLKIISQPKI